MLHRRSIKVVRYILFTSGCNASPYTIQYLQHGASGALQLQWWFSPAGSISLPNFGFSATRSLPVFFQSCYHTRNWVSGQNEYTPLCDFKIVSAAMFPAFFLSHLEDARPVLPDGANAGGGKPPPSLLLFAINNSAKRAWRYLRSLARFSSILFNNHSGSSLSAFATYFVWGIGPL